MITEQKKRQTKWKRNADEIPLPTHGVRHQQQRSILSGFATIKPVDAGRLGACGKGMHEEFIKFCRA